MNAGCIDYLWQDHRNQFTITHNSRSKNEILTFSLCLKQTACLHIIHGFTILLSLVFNQLISCGHHMVNECTKGLKSNLRGFCEQIILGQMLFLIPSYVSVTDQCKF